MKNLASAIYTILGICAMPFATGAATVSPTAIDSTINALDYVLRRPAPAEKFASKRFGDRLFLSVEAGPDWMRTNSSLVGVSESNPGYRVGVTLGDWITPVHGWRLGISAGRHRGAKNSRPYFAGLSLDYMMNLSALLRKDNPSRRFELIGIMGVEGEALHRRGHRLWGAGGARIGLQPRVYVTPATYLYIEPRIGIYSDGLDDVKSWHKYDWNASVMVGLGYRMSGGTGLKVDNSMFGNDYFRDNLFVSVSGGAVAPGNHTSGLRRRIGPSGTISIGKWFSAPAGLRLSATAVRLREEGHDTRNGVIGDIDWLWNLNSAFVGYDPDSPIETNVVLGASGLYRSGKGRKFHPGLHAALQGIWKISPSVGLYLEPNLRIFDKDLLSHSGRATLMPGLNVGLIYRFNSSDAYSSYKSKFDYRDFLTSRRYFFDLLGGVQMRSRSWHPNCVVSLGAGKWFTPESGWRVNGEIAYMDQRANYYSISLATDYLLNLSTVASGFDSDRAFELDAFVGMTAGAAHYNGNRNEIIWGPRAGLRGRIGLSDAVSLVIEPQLQVLSIPDYNRRFNPEARLLAGLSYRIGRTRKERAASGRPSGDRISEARPFVNLAGAAMLYSEALSYNGLRKVSGGFSASVGAWLSDASGLQLAFAYDYLPYSSKRDQEIKTLSLDYLLNLTNVFTGETGRRFEVSPLLGVGIGWGSAPRSKCSMALEGGIRTSCRLSEHFDLTLTPTVTVWRPRINGSRGNGHHFVGVGRLPLGLTYRF